MALPLKNLKSMLQYLNTSIEEWTQSYQCYA